MKLLGFYIFFLYHVIINFRKGKEKELMGVGGRIDVLLEAKCITILFWFSERKLRFLEFNIWILHHSGAHVRKKKKKSKTNKQERSLNLFLKLIYYSGTRKPQKSFMYLPPFKSSERRKCCYRYFRWQMLKHNCSDLIGTCWKNRVEAVPPKPQVLQELQEGEEQSQEHPVL